jgi:hypothetical protein
MAGFFDDSQAVQLAAFSILGGKPGGQAISDAMTQSALINEKKLQQQEYARKQQLQARLPALMSQVDFNDPNRAISQLISAGMGPAEAVAVLKAKTDYMQEGRLLEGQKIMQQALFGGAPQQSGMPDAMMQEAAGAGTAIPTNSNMGGIPMGQATPTMGGDSDAMRAQAQNLMKAAVASNNPTLMQYAKSLEDQAQKSTASAKDDSNKAKEFEYKISTDFDTASKDFIKVRDGFANIRTAAKRGTGAGDIQLIYGYMKTQDPTSTVRETEFATAENSGGVSERVRNLFNKVQEGQLLTDKQRQEFLSLGEKNYQTALKQHQKTAEGYKKKAQRFGLNPENIITDYSIIDDASAPAESIGGGAQKMQSPTIKLDRDLSTYSKAELEKLLEATQ